MCFGFGEGLGTTKAQIAYPPVGGLRKGSDNVLKTDEDIAMMLPDFCAEDCHDKLFYNHPHQYQRYLE